MRFRRSNAETDVTTRDGSTENERVFVGELIVETASTKRLTTSRVARVLAQNCPGFRRRKGRYATGAGVEVLPVVELIEGRWRAWRLETGSDAPSGYEPPLPGRTGKLNSANNPLADRKKGVWLRADIFEW